MAARTGERRPRGRTAGFRMTDEHRHKIANSNILKCLIEHASGKREMSATQVTAGIALLKKVLPDLSAVTLSGDEDNPIRYEDTSLHDLAHRIDRIAARAGEKEIPQRANGKASE